MINFWYVILIPFLFFSQNFDWELKIQEDGIEVYTRNVEHTKIKEFKASGIIPSSSENVLNMLKTVEGYPYWIQNVSYATLINAKNGYDFYYQLDMPWPLKDRDIAMRMKEVQSGSSTILFIHSLPSLMVEKKDFVRMKTVKGFWVVTPLTPTTCNVTYQFLADPEGALPTWAINMFLVDGPFKTLKNLQKYTNK